MVRPAEEKKEPQPPHSSGAAPATAHWVGWGVGLVSLVWFLVRVIPKPSRAAYPCQRATAPMASAFVLWLAALLGAKWALRHRRQSARQRRVLTAWAWTAVLVVCAGLALRSLPSNTSHAGAAPHGPLGVGKGIYPGRVVWVHAPDAASWAGWDSPEPWWQTNHTDLAVVEDMMAEALHRVAGETTDTAAWEKIFKYFNAGHNRGARGYQPGEKIAIKLNLTTCSGGGDCDPVTGEKIAHLNRIDNSPQMLLSLLRHLVYKVGANPADISLGDPTALLPGYLWNQLHGEFPNVHYFDGFGIAGRTLTLFSSVPFYWSTTSANGKLQDYIPLPFAEADYVINFAILKGHSAGVTLCGKNLYGALKRTPNGYWPGQGYLNYYDLHLSLPNEDWSPGLGQYRALVDLMRHPNLGGKTLLYFIDGLFGGYYWDAHPYPWKMPPFGDGTHGHWPASLFASQDPVAIDSVAYDFLLTEWPQVVQDGQGTTDSLQGGAEDYLHEAAQADHPPSGTFYDPTRSGTPLASLGVHEHWNNPIDKQYSRNLGQTNGIELVHSLLSKMAPRLALTRSGSQVVVSWPASQAGYTLQSATVLSPQGNWTNVASLPGLVQAQCVVTNACEGSVRFYRLVK